MKVLVIYMPGFSEVVAKVKRILSRHKIWFVAIDRRNKKKSHFKDIDLLMTIGGDGTFLRASQFISNKTEILGLNPDPKNKEGFFTRTTVDDFEKKLVKIIKKKHILH